LSKIKFVRTKSEPKCVIKLSKKEKTSGKLPTEVAKGNEPQFCPQQLTKTLEGILSRSRHAILESTRLARLLSENRFAPSPKLIWVNWYPVRRAILPFGNADFFWEISLMKSLAIAALLLASMATTSLAQSAAEHEQHHPQQDAAPAPTQPAPPASQSGMGMMGGAGMMNMMGNMPMMNMMQMMGMMGRSGAETGCAGMSGMATIDRVEGRIAFLRTELKITDAQTSVWNAFADALRANRKSLGEVRASMMSQQGAAPQALVDRLTLQEEWLAARLEGARAIKSTLTNLVATFSDDQKTAADELLAPHMGIMGMMAAMRSGQVGPGQMQPGMMMPGR
jgi:hypothetical protein